jgi:hypothetical protein
MQGPVECLQWVDRLPSVNGAPKALRHAEWAMVQRACPGCADSTKDTGNETSTTARTLPDRGAGRSLRVRSKLAIPAQLRATGARAFQTVVNDLSLSGFSATAITRMHPARPAG